MSGKYSGRTVSVRTVPFVSEIILNGRHFSVPLVARAAGARAAAADSRTTSHPARVSAVK